MTELFQGLNEDLNGLYFPRNLLHLTFGETRLQASEMLESSMADVQMYIDDENPWKSV